MILSVSRRTDIPGYYSEWFFNRIHAGFVDVRNPMNIHQVSEIKITPDVVDCIVFWSKNPKNMLNRLEELKDYKYYFQFTINPYDKSIEENVPKKNEIINTFKALSDKIGKDRVIWRYDPILISPTITLEYHINYFEVLIKKLYSYTDKCVVSFIDLYKKTERNLIGTNIREPNEKEMRILATAICNIARTYNIKVQSCAEEIDLSKEGIEHGKCIDGTLINNIVGYPISVNKDKSQRKECGCISSIDIGEYNTCIHNCLYCYANFNKKNTYLKYSQHDKNSPLLIGNLSSEDTVKIRKVESFRDDSIFPTKSRL